VYVPVYNPTVVYGAWPYPAYPPYYWPPPPGAVVGTALVTGMAFGVPLLGSALLTLALRVGRIDAVEAHAAARVEESFQEERWGVDEEAAARSALLLKDAIALERWFAALRAN
jgi:hypothetical protein